MPLFTRLQIALVALVLGSTLTACSPSPPVQTPPVQTPPVQTSPANERSTGPIAEAPPEAQAVEPAVDGEGTAVTEVAYAPGPQVTEAVGGYWPQFHGPEGDNISREKGLLSTWPKAGPALLWQNDKLGDGYSSVSIARGTIYTAGEIDKQDVVTALSLEGKIKWQTPVGPGWTGDYAGARATPAIDGDRLYYETAKGEVVCLSTKGKKLWSINVLEKFGAKNVHWGMAESLIVDGTKLICCPGGPKAAVVALNKLNGKVIWASPSADQLTSYATPTVATIGGVRMIVAMTANGALGVNADNGELLWTYEQPVQYFVHALKPIVHEDCVFTSAGYKSGSRKFKVTMKGKTAAVEELWKSDELDNHHHGVLLIDGYLYGTTHEKTRDKLVCLDWKTGEMKWSDRGVGKGSVTYADGLVYCLNEKGRVGLIKVSPEGAKVVGSFRLPEGPEGPTWAHPVVCGGRLYLRHDGSLYAYDVKAK